MLRNLATVLALVGAAADEACSWCEAGPCDVSQGNVTRALGEGTLQEELKSGVGQLALTRTTLAATRSTKLSSPRRTPPVDLPRATRRWQPRATRRC